MLDVVYACVLKISIIFMQPRSQSNSTSFILKELIANIYYILKAFSRIRESQNRLYHLIGIENS